MKRIIALLIIFLVAFPLASIAGERAVGGVMCACPGSHKPLGSAANCEEACYGKSGGTSGGSTLGQDLGTALGQALGQAIGNALRGDPEADARRKAEEDASAARAEEERRRQEEETLKRHEEMKNRLLGGMMNVGDSSQLGLMGVDLHVKETSGAFGQKELKPIIGDDQTTSSHVDTSVVDARVPRDGAYLTDQVPELKNSPAVDRITKGFQAVINHDWPVALAWWQDALNRDPNNAALKRSVDLAQWMVDKRKAKTAGPVTPLGAAMYSASYGDSAKAIRQFEQVKKENPAIAPQADDMIAALRQRQAKDAKAAEVSLEIKKQTQRLVDDLFETGMNRLSVGDEKGAQEAFNDATFFGLSANVQPSQLPAPN